MLRQPLVVVLVVKMVGLEVKHQLQMVVLVAVVVMTMRLVGMVYLVKEMMGQTRLGLGLRHHIPLLEVVEKAKIQAARTHIIRLVVLDHPQETQTTMVPPEVVAVAVVDILGVLLAVLVVLVVEALGVFTKPIVLVTLAQAQPILVEVVVDLNIIDPLLVAVLE